MTPAQYLANKIARSWNYWKKQEHLDGFQLAISFTEFEKVWQSHPKAHLPGYRCYKRNYTEPLSTTNIAIWKKGYGELYAMRNAWAHPARAARMKAKQALSGRDQKISATLTGQPKSLETIQKMSKPKSPEHRQAMSVAAKRRWETKRNA